MSTTKKTKTAKKAATKKRVKRPTKKQGQAETRAMVRLVSKASANHPSHGKALARIIGSSAAAPTAKSAPKKPSNLLGGLTASERQHLAQLIDRGKAKALGGDTDTSSISVYFYVQDGKDESGKHKHAFTVAMLAAGGELKGVGVAKVNPKLDEWSGEVGRKVALARAAMGEARLQ